MTEPPPKPKKQSPDLVEKIKLGVRKEAFRRTITIYVDLHSAEDLTSAPLPTEEEEPYMAKNMVVVEAGRIGICNYEDDDVTTPKEQSRNIYYLGKVYNRSRRAPITQLNRDYFSTLNPNKFTVVKYRPGFYDHGMPRDTFVEHVLPEYDSRAANHTFENTYRSYLNNKTWGTTNKITDHMNYYMGVYVIEVHNLPDEKYDAFHVALDDGMMGVTWKPPTHIPGESIVQFEWLQKRNLMNVEVSQMLCRELGKKDMPFGFAPSTTITGINQYQRTDLIHILKYFFNLGFEYVNILDQGCRFIHMDYSSSKSIKEGQALARQRSAAEKEAVKHLPFGMLKKKKSHKKKRKDGTRRTK